MEYISSYVSTVNFAAMYQPFDKLSVCDVFFMFQLRKNVMDVSYHIVQYSNIITELREEIKRLRIKLDNQQSYGNKPSIQAVQCMHKLFPTKVNDSDSFNSKFKNYWELQANFPF